MTTIYIEIEHKQIKEMFDRGMSYQEIQRYLILQGAKISDGFIRGRKLLEEDVQESIDWQTKIQQPNNEVNHE